MRSRLTVSALGSAVSGPGFAVSALGFAVSALGFAVSAPGFAVSAQGFAVSAPGFIVSALGFAVSGPGFACSALGLVVSGLGFDVLSLEPVKFCCCWSGGSALESAPAAPKAIRSKLSIRKCTFLKGKLKALKIYFLVYLA